MTSQMINVVVRSSVKGFFLWKRVGTSGRMVSVKFEHRWPPVRGGETYWLPYWIPDRDRHPVLPFRMASRNHLAIAMEPQPHLRFWVRWSDGRHNLQNSPNNKPASKGRITSEGRHNLEPRRQKTGKSSQPHSTDPETTRKNHPMWRHSCK